MKRWVVTLFIPLFILACAVDDDAERDAYPTAIGGEQTQEEIVGANEDRGAPLNSPLPEDTAADTESEPQAEQESAEGAAAPAPTWKHDSSATESVTRGAGSCADGAALQSTMSVKTTTGIGLNVREEAGVDQRLLGSLAENVIVKVWKVQMINGAQWACITGDDQGKMIKGWVAFEYLADLPAEP